MQFPGKTSMVLATWLVCAGALAQEPLSFRSCPIYRDTNTVPCWLAEHDGELYFLGIQTDASGWSAPWLGHELLVEGEVTDLPRVCGGIPMTSSGTPFDRRLSGTSEGIDLPNPPVTSVMREMNPACDEMLPMVPRYNTLEPRRGPGPNVFRAPVSAEEQAEQRAREEAEREANRPTPPYEAQTFVLHYEFDSELATLTLGQVREALAYAGQIGASEIRVTGYRAAVRLSNGDVLQEASYMARRRARELENTFSKLGLPEGTTLDVDWEEAQLPVDGIDDWDQRRAEILVIP